MKSWKTIKNVLASTCVFFTIITMTMGIISNFISDSKLAILFPVLLKFFIFSLFFSIFNRIFYVNSMNTAIKILIHYIGMAICFFVIFVASENKLLSSAGKFAIFILYTLIYAIIAAILLIIKYKRKKTEKDKEAYVSQFKDIKKR